MDFHKIKKDERIRVYRCYREAFPLRERMFYGLLLSRSHSGYADFWVVTEGENVLGLAYVCRNEKLCYLCYLAISHQHRGKGLGSKILDKIRKEYPNRPILIALEPRDAQAKNASQRVARHSFYAKNGFSDLPYEVEEGGVLFAAMSTAPVQPRDYNELMHDFLGPVGRMYLKMEMRPEKEAAHSL